MTVLAAAPVLLVLVLMVGLGWGAGRAGAAGWLAAVVLAAGAFGAGAELLLYSQLRALALSLFVLYIIWMALLLYQVVSAAGALETVAGGVARLSRRRLHQLLVLGWVFSSALQGVSGFGVPTAVVAPMLVGMGFAPLLAVAATSVGHAWAVSFGSVASSFYALVGASGLPGEVLAGPSAAVLGMLCLACGLAVAHLHGGWPGVVRGLPLILPLGLLMAAVQLLLASAGLWGLAAFGAGLAGLAGAGLVLRREWSAGPPLGAIAVASSAYLYLLLLVSVAQLVPPVSRLLDAVVLTMPVPPTASRLGWANPGGQTQPISLFGHPGALLLYSSLLAYATYRLAGRCPAGAWRAILRRAAASASGPTAGIVGMVGMALAMEMSGMTFLLAGALSTLAGPALTLAAPAVGALGAFMTGSNTNSNVVFGPLQRDSALLAGLAVPWVLAGQNAGGALGGIIAPAKAVVGAATVGLAGQEGRVLRRLVPYTAALLALASLATWVLGG